MADGSLNVRVNSSVVDFQQLPGGLEVVGLDRNAAATLNHEVLGHGGDYVAMSDPASPFTLRVGADNRLPSQYQLTGAAFTETTGWLESVAATRATFIDAVATGDVAASRAALENMSARLNGLNDFRATFEQTTDAALSAESQERIAQTLAGPKYSKTASGRDALVVGKQPGTAVYQFEILEQGVPTTMSTELPTALSAQARADLVITQFANGQFVLDDLAKKAEALSRDLEAMQAYAKAKLGVGRPSPRKPKPGIEP
jgi:hypothetical protein